MATDSSILAWRIHGLRSLVSDSPWGRKESDTTEHSTQYSTEMLTNQREKLLQ